MDANTHITAHDIRNMIAHARARAALGQFESAKRFAMNCIVAIERVVPHSAAWADVSSHLQSAVIVSQNDTEFFDRLESITYEAAVLV